MSVNDPAQTDQSSVPRDRSLTSDEPDERAQVRSYAKAVGLGFLALGALGFVPVITAHYGEMAFGGSGSGARLLGIFEVTIVLNLVYLAIGAAGLVGDRTAVSAKNYLVTAGAIAGLLGVFGLVIDREGSSNLLGVNGADTCLLLLLAVGLIGLGEWMGRRSTD